MADPAEVRKPDQLVVTGTSAGGQPITWRFDKGGLTSCTLGGWQVLSGTTGPVNADGWIDGAEVGKDKVGDPIGSRIQVTGKKCVVFQSYWQSRCGQVWSVEGEDAICDLTITNDKLDQTIRYPALAGLTAHFPAPASGVGVNDPTWTEGYLRYAGRAILTPSFYIRLRRSYLQGGGVGVAIVPLDLGDERCLIWWKDLPPDQWAAYTSRPWAILWDRAIGPGESRRMRLLVRVSDDPRPGRFEVHYPDPAKDIFTAWNRREAEVAAPICPDCRRPMQYSDGERQSREAPEIPPCWFCADCGHTSNA